MNNDNLKSHLILLGVSAAEIQNNFSCFLRLVNLLKKKNIQYDILEYNNGWICVHFNGHLLSMHDGIYFEVSDSLHRGEITEFNGTYTQLKNMLDKLSD